MTGGLAFLLIVFVLSGIGTIIIWVRNRDAASVDQGVEEFQREMRALSPEKQDDDRRRGRG